MIYLRGFLRNADYTPGVFSSDMEGYGISLCKLDVWSSAYPAKYDICRKGSAAACPEDSTTARMGRVTGGEGAPSCHHSDLKVLGAEDDLEVSWTGSSRESEKTNSFLYGHDNDGGVRRGPL